MMTRKGSNGLLLLLRRKNCRSHRAQDHHNAVEHDTQTQERNCPPEDKRLSAGSKVQMRFGEHPHKKCIEANTVNRGLELVVQREKPVHGIKENNTQADNQGHRPTTY